MIANMRVEDCEVVTAGRDNAPINVEAVSAGCFGTSVRPAFLCPHCGTRRFKLYRPPCSPDFLCRTCHTLTYTSSQKQDSRLNTLLKLPEDELMSWIQRTDGRMHVFSLLAGYTAVGVFTRKEALEIGRSL